MIIGSKREDEIRVKVKMDLFRRQLNGKGMPCELKINVIASIFRGKNDVRSYEPYREVKLFKHAIKFLNDQPLINLNSMQLRFTLEKETVNAKFIVDGILGARVYQEFYYSGRENGFWQTSRDGGSEDLFFFGDQHSKLGD